MASFRCMLFILLHTTYCHFHSLGSSRVSHVWLSGGSNGTCTRALHPSPITLCSYISASETGASNMYHSGVTHATNPTFAIISRLPRCRRPFHFLPLPCLPTNDPILFRSSPMPFLVTIRLVPVILTRTQRRINARHHALLYSESSEEKGRESSFYLSNCQVEKKKSAGD